MNRLAIFIHSRNNERRRSHRKPKRTTSQKRLHKLDAELPSCTLEHWWSKAKVPPAPAEGTDGNFVWYREPFGHCRMLVACYHWPEANGII